jgi:hypothetical protein
LLVVIQQLIAPPHRRGQRPLALLGQPVAVNQQREPVVHPVQQLRHPECVHPRRRQLDRERHPIEARDKLGHGRAGLRIEDEVRLYLPGSVREQRHRLGFLVGQARSAFRVFRVGQGSAAPAGT